MTAAGFDLLPPDRVAGDSGLLAAWRTAIEASPAINRLYASPDWFAHLQRHSPSDLFLAVVRPEAGPLTFCPVQVRPYRLLFDVASRSLAATRVRTAAVMGCEPLLPPAPELIHGFLRHLLEALPECDGVYLENVPTDSVVWRELHQPSGRGRDYLLYLPQAARPWYWLELEGGFQAFLATKSKKTRETLRRHVNKLRKHGHGDLVFERVTARTDIPGFFSRAKMVGERTWQHRVLGPRLGAGLLTEPAFADLADAGLFRSYLLSVGGRPVAFVVGYQHTGVYHYVELGFDAALGDRFAPGIVLLYLLLEDLHSTNPPRFLNYGVGDNVYKQRFSNNQGEDAAVLLLRPTFKNRARILGHRSFHTLVRVAKRVVRGRRPTPPPTADGEVGTAKG